MAGIANVLAPVAAILAPVAAVLPAIQPVFEAIAHPGPRCGGLRRGRRERQTHHQRARCLQSHRASPCTETAGRSRCRLIVNRPCGGGEGLLQHHRNVKNGEMQGVPIDFTTFTLQEIHTEIDAVARDAEAIFGRLTARQLNWKPAPDRWSVAQCFDHLIVINRLMLDGMARALEPSTPKAFVERVPGLPRLAGKFMIRSLSPTNPRRLPVPAPAAPSTSDLGSDVIGQFVAAQSATRERIESFEHRDLARITMVSPFASVVAYSVLDACRIIVAHERRHFEQARRVMESPGFTGE